MQRRLAPQVMTGQITFSFFVFKHFPFYEVPCGILENGEVLLSGNEFSFNRRKFIRGSIDCSKDNDGYGSGGYPLSPSSSTVASQVEIHQQFTKKQQTTLRRI